MSTKTFTPTRYATRLPTEFKSRWSSALRTSKQHKGDWISSDKSALCCLGVAMNIQGATVKDIALIGGIDDSPLPKQIYGANEIAAAMDEKGVDMTFAVLNDDYLTHPEIADLLEGKTVTIEVDDA